jgi:N-acyl-D-aspartate/D-glutamate deacylase
MHDLAIRGATIVDGTGQAAFAGDIAIDGERLTDVGGKAGKGRREVDATATRWDRLYVAGLRA